ncbi:MAG: hypothetical protein L0Z50_06175 [Verrucomicrobiales bacterium]|nr:hypothetical protein [Verrucomicrobiales bacterium]
MRSAKFGLRNDEPVPEPGQNDGGGFAKTGWDINQTRVAVGSTGKPFLLATIAPFAGREPALIIKRALLMSGGCFEELVEIHYTF